MTPVAASAVLVGWAVGAGVFLVTLPVVVILLHRVLRPLREVKRYTDDILEAGLAISRNLEGIGEALTTRELATALPELAPPALERLGVRP
jgi:hypothetical protein